MPGDIDYINFGRMIIPLELNYCQCMLELEEYYDVIEHTTELLEKHKGTPLNYIHCIMLINNYSTKTYYVFSYSIQEEMTEIYLCCCIKGHFGF